MPNDLLPLYQAASQKFNVGSYENFQLKMKDPKLRRSFYDAAVKDFNLPDYDKFSSKVDSALRLSSTTPVDTRSLGPSPNLGDKLTSTPAATSSTPNVTYPKKQINKVDKEPTDQSMVQKAKNLITDYFAGWVPSVPEAKMEGAAPVGQFPSGNKQIAIAKKNITDGDIKDDLETRDKLVGLGVMHEEVLKAKNTNFLKEIINQPASNTFYGQQYRLPTQIDSFLKPRSEILDNLNKVYADTSFIRPIQSKYDSIFQKDPEYVALNKSLEAAIQNLKVEASKTFDLSSAEGNANAQNFVRQKGAELNQVYNAKITDLWQSKYFTPFKTEIDDAFNLKIDAVISPSKTILGSDYIRKAQSAFESPEFQGKSYEEKKKLMDHAWQNKAIELHNAGVSPNDIFEARKQFYYHVVRPAYITDKGNLTTFSLRSYAEQTLPEIDKQLAELKKELNVARNDGIQKNGSLSKESIDKYKEYRLLVQTRENLVKIGTLPENYQGWFYQGAINKRMTDFIPFIKSIADIPDNVNLLSIKNKVRDGKTLSPIETLLLQSETAKNDIESQITPNYWYTAGQITTGMFPYIGEFAATSGIYSSAKTVVGQGLQKIATKAGTSILDLGKISAAQSAKSAGSVIFAESAAGRSSEALASLIGGIAQTAGNPQMYINTTLERMQPGMVMAFSPDGTKLLYQLDESQKGRGEDFSTAFAKAFGTSWAEFATERIGEVIPWMGDTFSKKVLNDPDFMKRLTVGYWLARHGIGPNEAIQEIFKHNLSYSNMIGEQFEEWVNSPLSNIITGDQGVFEGYNKEFFATTALGIGAFAPIASVGSFLPKAKSTVRYFDVNQNPVAVNISNGKLGQLYALRNAGVMSIRDFRKKNLGKFAAGDERIYAEQVLNAFETRATAKKVGAPGMSEAEVAMKVNRYKNIPVAHASALLAELNSKIKEQTNVAVGMTESQTVPIIDVVPPVIGIDMPDPAHHIPVDTPFPQDDLDEDMKDELEGIKKEIVPDTEIKNKAKLSVIGNKEFISVENIEYEVKKSKSGSIIFENSVSGKEVDRRSPIYDKVVSGYLVEKYSRTPDLDVSDINSEEDYYHKLGTEGENPLEILIGAAYMDGMEGGSLQFSGKDLRIADAHISFNNEDVRRHFGYDLSDLPNWQALRDNYYGKNAKGIDQSVADINLSEDFDRFTEDDLWDFMFRFPNGLDESKLMGENTSRLGARFTEVTGIQFDRQLLETFKKVHATANKISDEDAGKIDTWLTEHPEGTIIEMTAEVPLSDEAKTIINESNNGEEWWPEGWGQGPATESKPENKTGNESDQAGKEQPKDTPKESVKEEVERTTPESDEEEAPEKVAIGTDKDVVPPKYKSSNQKLNDSELNTIGDALKKRFGINYRTVTQDEAKAILNSDRDFFFGILDDIDLFDNVDQNEAKAFILKVYRTVANKEEARKAYRKLSFKYHPDKGADALELMKYLNVVNDNYNKGIISDSHARRPGYQGSGRTGHQQRNTYEDFRRDQEEQMRDWQRRQQERQRQYERERQAAKGAYEEQMRQRKEKQSIYDTITKQARERRDRRKENARKKRDADKAAFRAANPNMSVSDWLTASSAIDKAYTVEVIAADKEYMDAIMDATKRYRMQKYDGPMPAGFYDDATETAYFVSGVADETTPIHEAFSHPFILAIEKRNPELYDRLQKSVRKNKEVKEFVDSKYPNASARMKTHEMIARAIDLEARKQLEDKSLIDLIKEFWQEVKRTLLNMFGRKAKIGQESYTPEDIDANTSIEDIANFVLRSAIKMDLRRPVESDIETIGFEFGRTRPQDISSWMQTQLLGIGTIDFNKFNLLFKKIGIPPLKKDAAGKIENTDDYVRRHIGAIQTYFEAKKPPVAPPAEKLSDDIEAKLNDLLGEILFQRIDEVKPITTVSKLKSNSHYLAAKRGNIVDAFRLVEDILTDAHATTIKDAISKYPDAVIVPVHAIEAEGINQIPMAFAVKISKLTGNEVDTRIIQADKSFHTDASRISRFFSRPSFEGKVLDGKSYIIVDDVSTSGSTLKALKDYIEDNGGKVVRVLVLGVGRGGSRFETTNLQKKLLINKFGKDKLDKFLYETGRANINELTESEVEFLQSFDSINEVREKYFAYERTRVESEIRQTPRAETQGPLGIAYQIPEEEEVTPAQMAKGMALIKAMFSSSMYDFPKIVTALQSRVGPEAMQKLLPILKSAYGGVAYNSPADVRSKLTNNEIVSNFKLPVQNEEPSDIRNATGTKSGSGTTSDLFSGDQPGISGISGEAPDETEEVSPMETDTGGTGTDQSTETGGNGSGSAGGGGRRTKSGRNTRSNPRSKSTESSSEETADPIDPANRNFVITQSTDLVPKGEMSKIRANIEAIELLKELEKADRNPTPEEKTILAQFTGWGGLATVLDVNKAAERGQTAWKDKYLVMHNQIVKLLTPSELKSAIASTPSAHYTSKDIISHMWTIAERLGFRGGRVLEPAAGVGHFNGLIPRNLVPNSKMDMVELDQISGRIAAKLYPQSNVQVSGFEEARLQPASYDLAISNVPFGFIKVYDKNFEDLTKWNIHNYFIGKSMRMVKPGGLGVLITTANTMDRVTIQDFREYMNEHEEVDFIGAIRLPWNAFKWNAGTEVTTDILIFRKRTDSGKVHPQAQLWSMSVPHRETLDEDGDPFTQFINEYFHDSPDMMMGEMRLAHEAGKGGLNTANDNVLVPTSDDLNGMIENAIDKLPQNISNTTGSDSSATTEDLLSEERDVDGGYYIDENGEIYTSENGVRLYVDFENEKVTLSGGKSVSVETVFKLFINVKQLAKKLVQSERSVKFTDDELNEQRRKLLIAYLNFHERYGRINRNNKLSFLKEDSEFAIVYSLEKITQKIERNKAGNAYYKYEIAPGDILSRRVNYPYVIPTSAESISDAVNISVIYKGTINIDYVAKLLDINPDAVRQMILEERLAFVDPITGMLIDHDEYISGNVREKLKQAELAAQTDANFERNVTSLKEVLPPWAPMHLITPGIGSTWIPLSVYKSFMIDQDIQADISFNDSVSKNRYSVKFNKYRSSNSLGEATWGYQNTETGKIIYDAAEMMEKALNNGDVKVYKIDPTDAEGKRRLVDHEKTAEARLKLEGLKSEFEAWVKRTESIHDELEQSFNNEVQGFVEYKSTRVIKRFPEQAEFIDGEEFNLRQHQSRAAFRALRRSTYLAHDVGSGKTYTLISIAMEWKRLKLANKTLIVVHNPTFEQFNASASKLYPGKRILMATKKDMQKENRQRFFASIAYGAWDAVIIPKSFLEKIPNDPDRERAMLQAEIANLEAQKANMDNEEKKQFSRDIAKLKKRMEKLGAKPIADKKTRKVKDEGRQTLRDRKKFAEINNQKKDATFYFEDMGIDAIILDEADAYKKVGFDTSLPNIRGIDVQRSNIAWDAFTKTRFIMQQNGGRNVVMASGTPITNTMAEMWTVMRYISPTMLKELGIDTFDSFAASFTHITQSLELTATGVYKELPRMREFINLPALVAAFRTNVDVVTNEDILEFKESRLVPNKEVEQIVLEMSFATKEVIDTIRSLAVWWDNLHGYQQSKLIWLPIVLYGLAKKAAVDVRLLNNKYKKYPEDPNSKLNQTAIRAAEVYHETTGIKGTQLIFCDSIRSRDSSFNAHQEIRKNLISNGVLPSEIVIADDKFDGLRRALVMQDMNEGKVRFLIGHTDKIGVGINVQERVVALWHVDAPDLPSKMTQRNGRGIRQGNLCALSIEEGGFDRPVMVKEVGVKDTMDALAYQRLEIKGKFINQALSNFLDWSAHDDIDISDGDLQNGIMASMLAGSSTGLLLRESQRMLRQLEAAYNNYRLREGKLAGRVKELEAIIPALYSRKPFLNAFMEDLPNWMDFERTEDGKMKSSDRKITSVTIDGVVYKEKFGQAIDEAQAKAIQKLHEKGRDAGGNVKVVMKFGDHMTAVITNRFGAWVDGGQTGMFNEEARGNNYDKKTEPIFDTNAIGSEVQLFLDERMEDTFNFNGGISLGNRIYGKVKDIAFEHETIDIRISEYQSEIDKIKGQIGQPFEKKEEMDMIQKQISELEAQLLEEGTISDGEGELDSTSMELLEIIQRLIADDREREQRKEERKQRKGKKESDQERKQREEDEKMDADEPTEKSEDTEDSDVKGLGSGTEEEEEGPFMQFTDDSKSVSLQERIDNRLKQLYDSVDSEFAKMGSGGKAYLLPPKLILKGALKIIRYSVKAGFSVARAIRNALNYIKTTNWYRDQAKKGNPYKMDDFVQMLNDYGISTAHDIDSLDNYLKRIRKFVNNAAPGDMETALDNLTNYITQRVKSIGLSDTRLFLDAIDKIRKSQGNSARLATAITRFEQALDRFIYREQYREAIQAKRDARRNLIKQQKFPDIRLLGMELVNLPIIKSRQRLPVNLLFKYLQAINPLAARGRELLPDVNLIREVIREVTDWANEIETVEPEEREASEATAERKERQRQEWSDQIDEMKDSFDPMSIVRHPEIDKQLQQKVREFVNIDHHGLTFNQMKNYYGIMYNLYHNKLVSGHMDKDWVLPARKQQKAATIVSMKRETEFYFKNIRELAEELKRNPKTLWDPILLKPDPNMKYDAPFWQHYIQPITTAIERFRTDYQTVKHQLDKLYDALGTGIDSRSKAAMMVRMWAFANQVDHNRPDIDFKKKLNDSISNMRESSFYSDVFEMDYMDAYNALKFTTPADDTEERVIDLQSTWDSFTPAQKAFANGLHDLVEERLQPIVQYLQMYVRGENVNFIENYHPMTILGGVNVDEAKLENQIAAMESGDGLRDAIMNTKASSMFQRTYPKKVFYSFAYQSLLGSIEGTLFDKHLTEPIREVFGAMITPTFTDAMTSDLATTLRDQVMIMLKHEIGFNELSKSTGQKIVDALIRSLTGQALISVKRFAEYIPNWTIAAAYISDDPYDAVKKIYSSSRDFFTYSRDWLELMRNNGFSIYQRFSTHTELVDMPGGQSMILHNPFMSPLKHWKESKTTMKKYDHRNRSKMETLAFDTFNAWQHNVVRRTGDLIQQLSIGIGDYPSSFPIWVASFRRYLKEHGYDENIAVQDITTQLPYEVVSAAGNYAEKIVDKSIGVSNRGRAAEKVYSFQNEDERKAWYAYAMGRFRYFLGVLMYQQTAYAQRYASDLILGKGEYGRLKSAGIIMGYLAGNMAFNVMSKMISAIIIGMGGDPKEKKAQLADLYTKEYWARNLFSAGLQLFALGRMPYFNKIIFNALAEMANKRVTQDLIGHAYNSYHDALLYSPHLPLPTEWAQAKQVYNIFMPFTSPLDKLYQPVLDAMDVVGNGNPDDDALAKYNMARAALAMGNLMIQVPFINKEILNTLNQRSMPVKPSDYSSLHDQQYDMEKVKQDAQKLYDTKYSKMPKEEAMDSINFKIADPETPESERLILQQTKKVVEIPKYPLSKRQKFIHNLPAEAKPAYIKEELRGATDAQVKAELQSFRDLNVISDYLYLELMDAMYYSKEQNRQEMTPKEQREYRYRAKLRANKQ